MEELDENIKFKVDGDTLTLEFDLTKDLGASSSGKSDIIATTHGFKPIPYVSGDGRKVSIGINLIRKKLKKR